MEPEPEVIRVASVEFCPACCERALAHPDLFNELGGLDEDQAREKLAILKAVLCRDDAAAVERAVLGLLD